MKTYWSIDIDFWGVWWKRPRKLTHNTLDALLTTGAPILLGRTHSELAKHASSTSFDTLINFDYHADIGNDDQSLPCIRTESIGEGNWINFVKQARQNAYLWIYPERYCIEKAPGGGLCHTHGYGSPFNRSENTSGWKKVRRLCKARLPAPHTQDIAAIGIVVSPNWSHPDNIITFLDWARRRSSRVQTTKLFDDHLRKNWTRRKAR